MSVNETTGKVGRPALPETEKRWKFISTRISPGEYDEIVQAAKESGMGKTKWVRTRLVAAARRSPDTTAKTTVQSQAHNEISPQANIMSDLAILD